MYTSTSISYYDGLSNDPSVEVVVAREAYKRDINNYKISRKRMNKRTKDGLMIHHQWPINGPKNTYKRGTTTLVCTKAVIDGVDVGPVYMKLPEDEYVPEFLFKQFK